MNFLKNIFTQKTKSVTSYEAFWDWFVKNEKTFYTVVKEQGNIEQVFFDKLSAKLNELKDGFYFLTGMFNDDIVELVLTVDGAIKNIVFVEELVDASPKIDRWKFTALKPALSIKDVSIKMNDYIFTSKNISFYSNDNELYPDEIDLSIVHDDLQENNRDTIINGVYIFLDNFLGELNFASTIDNIAFISKQDATKELVPIEKLKDFLMWRQKEFIEKYAGTRHDTANDSYSLLEATLENGNALLAVVNRDILDWDAKASHPWILEIKINFDGSGNNGMPDNTTSELLYKIEDDLIQQLQDNEGYLNIGRQTVDGVREIYFACKDFRLPSKVVYSTQVKYAKQLDITYTIYKDKYWQSFEQFKN